MKITTKVLIVFMVCALTLTAKKVQAINITITGSWLLTIDASNLQAGAGSDLIDTYESASDVKISRAGGREEKDWRNWRVDVKKTHTNWHSNFLLEVIRTSDGTGRGTISGGNTSYQEVTDAYKSFFSGLGDRRGVHVRLELSGVSVQVPPDTYTTTVYYTVVEL